jgi:hypothetical protein
VVAAGAVALAVGLLLSRPAGGVVATVGALAVLAAMTLVLRVVTRDELRALVRSR